MNPNYRLIPFTCSEKFDFTLDRLAQDKRNIELDEAIISWCIELSLEKYFPKISQEIIANKNLWLQHNTVSRIALQLYRKLLVVTDRANTKGFGNITGFLSNISRTNFQGNIKNTKSQMSIKSTIFVAFIFTGIGVLLYLLNRKESSNNSRHIARTRSHSNDTAAVREKYILALLIKSDRYQELIHSLKNNSYLTTEDSSKLYGATQGLWMGAKSKFNQSKIKQELINCNPVTTTSEYDVNFVTIELDEDDSRFYRDVNPMDRQDGFIELVKQSSLITVSPRLSCKTYENTEFYSR